ncbi:CCDC90 family protein [Massilia sp. PAMC28688]|uniref:CCDC90 family protein n=1 Tax=Massilia sp. PAMC28688 TaxID=2861283 RepID=UPI001E572EE8|nr:CCDC90 family protein [Massilia sp. PAMC28688]
MHRSSDNDINAQSATAESRVEARLVSIESKMDVRFAELKTDIERVKAEVDRGNADTIKWVAGIVISAVALGLTVMTFVLNNAVPRATTAAPAPIVITIPSAEPAAGR